MSNPILSIGIIFKNDIRCIERCLKSLEPLRKAIPCELVMADTGSTDGSRAVAEKYADILFDFPWVNDFSAARNAVLDHCTGKWYLTVDTDEWLGEDFSQLLTFLKGTEADHSDEARIIQRNFMDQDFEDYTDFFAARMGRIRGGKLRYFAPIHEYLGYTDRPFSSTTALSKVILNHDGYLDMTPGAIADKQKRNMRLLREELKKNPKSVRTLKHCLDSAETPGERHRLVERTRKTMAEQPCTPFFATVYDTCARDYWNDKDFESLEQCLDEWHKRIPDSAIYQLDGEYLRASMAYKQEDYEKTLKHLQAYEKGLADADSGADLSRMDRLNAMYVYSNSDCRQRMLCTRFHCLCRLGRFEQADFFLKDPALLDMKIPRKGALILKVLESLGNLKQAAPFLRAVWDRAQTDLVNATDGKKYHDLKIWADDLATMFQQHYEKHGEHVLEQFVQMNERAPGRSARILLTQDPEKITEEWNGVTEWKHMFPQAYLHTMELRLPLPEGFYQQNVEQLTSLTVTLSKQPSMPRTALDWLTHIDPPQTPGQLVWQLNLVTAALCTSGWSEDVPVGQGLCGLYAALSATYLDNIYNPELLNQDDLSVLPGMHRFAFYLRQALTAWEDGDELGYVRALRSGLDTAPAMKECVDFLLEHKPQTAAQRQLEELAQQVHTVLSQYASDDPAVEALKASPAYQKVAHLLEPMASLAKPQEPPASPLPLEEALAGSKEEIAASIQENLGRWGEKLAQRRMDYWEKYPLWGKNRDEVVDNLSTALSAHAADFRWLFDRLEDEFSRHLLTVVVRAWRFYEFEPLGHLFDEDNDDYFDRSLLHCDDHEVVADLGAFTGDTFLSYVKNYGSLAYRRYYCYEITQDSFDTLQAVTAPYPRVVLRLKGAGDGPGVMTLDTGAAASANTLTSGEGATGDTVELVALDDDISEPLTLIKMDIEGAEQAALRGCARHIREDRPKLALSVYHNFEDLWKLPQMIDELAPGYRFYLRYHGGNLWPNEITLLGIPQEER